MPGAPPPYLRPYLQAAAKHGGGFGSLLWASPTTQAKRFDALRRAYGLDGKTLLDAGCGRADLASFLIDRGVELAGYVGLEAVDALAEVAESRLFPRTRIVRGDFVRDASLLGAGADVILFSGSLNTLSPGQFAATLAAAFDAAGEAVVFNFLCTPSLAAAEHLTWHATTDVERLARGLTPHVLRLADYLDGDCTIAMWKPRRGGQGGLKSAR